MCILFQICNCLALSCFLGFSAARKNTGRVVYFKNLKMLNEGGGGSGEESTFFRLKYAKELESGSDQKSEMMFVISGFDFSSRYNFDHFESTSRLGQKYDAIFVISDPT